MSADPTLRDSLSGWGDLMSIKNRIRWIVSAIVITCCLPGRGVSQPLYLYGVDGDDDIMVRVDVEAGVPIVETLGTVVSGGNPVPEMEAMTWDPDLARLIVVSNAGAGPVYRIRLEDINPPGNIPTTFVGNTGSIQIEGVALHPTELVYYAVDNTTNPPLLVKIDRFSGMVMTEVGELEDVNGNNFSNVEGLAFTSSAPYVLYGASNPGEGPSTLIVINTTTAVVTPIGTGIGFVNVECLDFAPDGTLYGFSNGAGLEDHFITIDVGTGVGTVFKVVDAKGIDIEGCAFTQADTEVGVEASTWSNAKQLYKVP